MESAVGPAACVELCRLPPDTPFPVRFVEVPAEYQRLRFSAVLPLFQMCQNVGILRARG
jgi:hypothetical protein